MSLARMGIRLVGVVLLLLGGGNMSAARRASGGAWEAQTDLSEWLQLVLQADPPFDPVRPSLIGHGDFITYTLTITNIGSEVQTQVVLSNSAPAGTRSVASSVRPQPARTPESIFGPIVWEVASLAPGEVFTAHYTVRVSNYVTVTAIVNKAYASSAETPVMQSNTTVHPFDFAKNPPVPFIYYLFLLPIP